MARKRKKKSNRKKLKEKLDDICREIILLRDKGRCRKCTKPVSGSNAHTSHIIPKSKGDALRWDLLNLMLKCFHCHIHWWHKNPIEAQDWFWLNFPETHTYLWAHKNDIVKFTESDLEKMLEERKEILKGLTEC